VIAEGLDTDPVQLTNEQLEQFCDTADGDVASAVDLKGCCKIKDVRCLLKLRNMLELNLAGCVGLIDKQGCVPGTYDTTTLVEMLKSHPCLTHLNIAQMELTDRGAKHILQTIRRFRCADGQQFTSNGWMTFRVETCKKCGERKEDHAHGGLTSVDISGNKLATQASGKILGDLLADNSALRELNLSGNAWTSPRRNKCDGAAFAQAIAGGLSSNKNTLVKLNILSNNISVQQALELIKIRASSPSLTTLCGLIGDEISLNLSSRRMSAGCVVLLTSEIKSSTSLNKLNLSKNAIATAAAGKALSSYLAENKSLTELDVSDNRVQRSYGPMSPAGSDGAHFVRALAAGLATNRHLLLLDISNNRLVGGKGTGDYTT
jgi:Leucine-rich repeat (LRR) protein